jgi:hypothetical protein
MIRWLVGESAAFHQLTGCKIILCTDESSALVQNELSPANCDSIKKTQCVSALFAVRTAEDERLSRGLIGKGVDLINSLKRVFCRIGGQTFHLWTRTIPCSITL